MEAAVARDVERLRALQNDDGGFAFWRRGDESWPYLTVHVAHALARAKEKGFAVPAQMLRALARVPARASTATSRPDYGPTTSAARSWPTRSTSGTAWATAIPRRARALVREAGVAKLSLEAIGWLLPVLSGDAASQAEVAAIRTPPREPRHRDRGRRALRRGLRRQARTCCSTPTGAPTRSCSRR